MDKMVTAVIAGTERQLNYSIEVMFDTAEKFGDIKSALDIVSEDSADGFEAVKWFAIRMANDAEHAKVTRAMRYDVLRRDDFHCVRCGRGREDGVKLHVDHILPVSRGGKTVMSNLQTLCEDCNCGKGNRYLE